MVEDGPIKKKSRKQKQAEGSKTDAGSHAQEPTLSRLTARQLAVARLVSSYKYECKKVFKQVLDRQEKWKGDLELEKNPVAQDVAAESNEAEERAMEEGAPSPSVASKRKGVVWKQAEREALKKWFLAFGFHRWQEIESGMERSLKVVRHGSGDLEDCCWEFVCELMKHVQGRELEYLQQQLEMVKSRLPIHTSGVPWTKVQSSAKIWARRLQLLENITAIVEQMKDDEAMDFFESSLKLASDGNPPASWWTSKTDLCLIKGVHKHGYGNYDAVRTDPEFSWAFGQGHPRAETQVDSTNKDDQSKKGASSQWPATDLLTKRLKRVTEQLNSIQTHKGAKKLSQPEELASPILWSRKDKMEMVKTLMTFGLPDERNHCHYPEPQPRVDWKFLKEHTSFQHHQESAVRQMCEELVAEVEEMFGYNEAHRKLTHPEDCHCGLCTTRRKSKAMVSNQGEEGTSQGMSHPPERSHQDNQQDRDVDAMEVSGSPSGAPANMVRVLTSQTATKLRDRLDMFSTLRKGYLLLRGRKLHDLLTTRIQDLPEWWVAGLHDVELATGALRHGVGAWVAIERDPSLSFLSCSQLFALTAQKLPDNCKSNPITEAERLASVSEVTLETPPMGGDGILPDSRVLLRRLKHIAFLLKKHFRQHGFPLPSAHPDVIMTDTGTSSKSPKSAVKVLQPRHKKPKYSKNIKVDRDPSGKPILPLTLTSMLALIDLGKIEWQRGNFHSERHIYPIGFKTRRRYSSTIDPHGTTTYTCSILDGGTRPLFTISADDNPHLKIQNDTPSGSWADLFCRVYDAKGIKKDKVVISGTDMFGLSHPTISRLIQELKNVEKCTYFIPELSFYPPDYAQDEGLESGAGGRIETAQVIDSHPTEATGVTQGVPIRSQQGLQGVGHMESHQYPHPGPAAITRQDCSVPPTPLQVHPSHAPIMRKPTCGTPGVLPPGQIGHSTDHLVPGPYQMSATTPWLGELANQGGPTPSLPSQLSVALNRGSGGPQGSSEQVSSSTGLTNQQIGFWDVLPQMGQLQHGGGSRMAAPQMAHGVVPIQFYNRLGGGDMRRVQAGGEPMCDPRVMPASLAHEFEAPQFGFRNPASMQRLHVMSGDGMRLNAPDRQGNVERRANVGGLPGNLAPPWPVSLMGGAAVMMPQTPDVQFSNQSDPPRTSDILGPDHASTPKG